MRRSARAGDGPCAGGTETSASRNREFSLNQPIPFGKYCLLDRISVGGMAEVFRAKTFGVQGFSKIIAIKRILPTMAEDSEFVTMFIDEAKIAAQLNHSNICQIYELGKLGRFHYIAMEYIHGKNLLQLQNRFKSDDRAMPVDMACFALQKVCEGLDYAHRKKDNQLRDIGLVHRDVSPPNILVSFDGEVKIIDFGIAKATARETKTLVGVLKGKFGYMSPEQVRGLALDRRSDIFAAGTVLYEVITGKRLFVGESDFGTLEKVRKVDIDPPSVVAPWVDAELERIIMKSLTREREERYQWARELAEDLARYLQDHYPGYSSKDLGDWMRATFTQEMREEQERIEYYATLGRPEDLRPAPDAPSPRRGSHEAEAAQLEGESTTVFAYNSDLPLDFLEARALSEAESNRSDTQDASDDATDAVSAVTDEEYARIMGEAAASSGQGAPVNERLPTQPLSAGPAGALTPLPQNQRVPGPGDPGTVNLSLDELEFVGDGPGPAAPALPSGRPAGPALQPQDLALADTPPSGVKAIPSGPPSTVPDRPLRQNVADDDFMREGPPDTVPAPSPYDATPAPSPYGAAPAPSPYGAVPAASPLPFSLEPGPAAARSGAHSSSGQAVVVSSPPPGLAQGRNGSQVPLSAGLGEQRTIRLDAADVPELASMLSGPRPQQGPEPATLRLGAESSDFAPPRPVAASAGPGKALLLAGVALVLLAALGAGGWFWGRPLLAHWLPGEAALALEGPDEPGLRILLDGEELGRSLPHRAEGLSPGKHQLVVESERHRPYRREVELPAAGALDHRVELELKPERWGRLRLHLQPGGPAKVYLGDAEAGSLAPGETETEIKVRPGQDQELRIVRSGSVTHRSPLRMAEQEQRDEFVELQELLGEVHLDSDPSKSTVFVNGKRAGTTPLNLRRLSPDKPVVLQIKRSGYEPWEQAFVFDGDHPRFEQVVPLVRLGAAAEEHEEEPAASAAGPEGYLTITAGSDVWARVFLDGEDTGKRTPISEFGKLSLPAGEHTVTLKLGSQQVEKQVTVRAGEITRVKLRFP